MIEILIILLSIKSLTSSARVVLRFLFVLRNGGLVLTQAQKKVSSGATEKIDGAGEYDPALVLHIFASQPITCIIL